MWQVTSRGDIGQTYLTRCHLHTLASPRRNDCEIVSRSAPFSRAGARQSSEIAFFLLDGKHPSHEKKKAICHRIFLAEMMLPRTHCNYTDTRKLDVIEARSRLWSEKCNNQAKIPDPDHRNLSYKCD